MLFFLFLLFKKSSSPLAKLCAGIMMIAVVLLLFTMGGTKPENDNLRSGQAHHATSTGTMSQTTVTTTNSTTSTSSSSLSAGRGGLGGPAAAAAAVPEYHETEAEKEASDQEDLEEVR